MENYDSKRYYWIKLKTDFFQREEIDFLMSQENGSDYVVLYLMLCSKVANNNGLLCSSVGEMMVKYDVDKITRDCIYFNRDTVVVALELYKKLGLVYEDNNGIMVVSNYENMVGSETVWARKKRDYRLKKNERQCIGLEKDNVRQENRDKSIDNRDIDIDIKKENNIKEKRFVKPTLEQVESYIQEKGYNIDAERFIDYYESNGWKVGKNPMKDWKAAVRTWARNNKQSENKLTQPFNQGKSTNSYRNEINKTIVEALEKGEIF